MTVTSVNDAPVITTNSGNAVSVSVAENLTTPVYTVSASDVDTGDTRSYSLTGADAAKFNIDSSTGVVSWVSAPVRL